jgi:hypothetical protein
MTDGSAPATGPRFPVYVVSYGRAETCLTAREHERMGVPYHLVIEADQYDAYAAEWPEDRLLVVPESYHEQYETYDDLGERKPKGPGPARNFAWDHARERGADWHWVMDDNISRFIHYRDNLEIVAGDGGFWRAMEDFVLRYRNIAMAGPRYQMFNIKRQQSPPVTFNTRVYSCNLIRNDTGYRWAGRYNEDTDLSLRMLKDGWCTAVMNLFLQKKEATQTYSGGNTENFYESEGTYPKSRMLKQQHPSLTTITKRWGRWHHRVDYSAFDSNKLVPKDDPDIRRGDYSFAVVPREEVDG